MLPKKSKEGPVEALVRMKQELEEGQVLPAYLLHGDEELLLSEALEAIRTATLGKGPASFNLTSYQGAAANIRSLVEVAMTLPMMGPRRLIVLRDAHQVKDAELAKLKAYLEKPSPTTTVVALAERQKGSSGLKGMFNKGGLVLELRSLYESELPTFIQAEVRRLKKTVAPEGVRYLEEMVGGNLREIRSELQKVSLFVGDRSAITVKDLEQVISDVSLDSLFEFAGAVGQGDIKESLLQLEKLTTSGQKPIVILAQLQRHFRQLAQAREQLQDLRLPEDEVAISMGTPPSMVWRWKKEFLPQVRNRSEKSLLKALARLHQAQLDLRTSRPTERLIGQVVLELCQTAKT